MDMIVDLFKDNFVFIVLIIVAFLVIRVVAQKVFSIVGAIFIGALVFYAFTGDASLLNKTVDTSTTAVDSVKAEVGSVEFKRTSDTTFTLTSKTMTITGNEETRTATIKTKDNTVEVPLKSLYNVLDKATQKKINFE